MIINNITVTLMTPFTFPDALYNGIPVAGTIMTLCNSAGWEIAKCRVKFEKTASNKFELSEISPIDPTSAELWQLVDNGTAWDNDYSVVSAKLTDYEYTGFHLNGYSVSDMNGTGLVKLSSTDFSISPQTIVVDSFSVEYSVDPSSDVQDFIISDTASVNTTLLFPRLKLYIMEEAAPDVTMLSQTMSYQERKALLQNYVLIENYDANVYASPIKDGTATWFLLVPNSLGDFAVHESYIYGTVGTTGTDLIMPDVNLKAQNFYRRTSSSAEISGTLDSSVQVTIPLALSL